MKYDLIVFDWDGTLMDSESRIVSCIQAAATDLGMYVPPADEAKDIIGLGLHDAIARLWNITREKDVNAIAERYRVHFLGDELVHSEFFEGVEEALENLASQEYFLAVATGKSRRGLKKELERTGIGGIFHTTRCADESRSKPHPQMMLDILDFLGMEPEQTLVVGDTEYDMAMAVNAGATAIGVSCGVHTPERLLDNGAVECLDHVSQLPAWLDS
ncbi:MAG: HAD-IA family hydrolase [bacterium]